MSFVATADNLRLLVERMKPLRAGGAPWAVNMLWGDDAVEMTASGHNVSAEAQIVADAKGGGEVRIPLTKLALWLENVEGDIEVETGNDGLTFLAEDADLPVPFYLEEIGYPPIDPNEMMALHPSVWPAISRVAFAPDPLPPEKAAGWRNMIHVSPGYVWAGSDLSGIAAVDVPDNEHRIALYPEVTSLVKLLEPDVRTMVDRENRLHLRDSIGKYVVSTFLGDVPDVPALTTQYRGPLKPKVNFTADRKTLLDALAAIRAVQVTDSFRLIVGIEDDGVRLSVETGDGVASRLVACEHTAEGELVTCTRLASFRAMIAGSKEPEVTVFMGDDTTPQVITDDDYTAMCSPILRGALARRPKRTRAAA